jgi:hypothetical protein
MKILRTQGLSARGSSPRGTRFPAISRRICQKFARNHNFVTSTPSGIGGPSAKPRWLHDPGAILAFAVRRGDAYGARRIGTDKRIPWSGG